MANKFFNKYLLAAYISALPGLAVAQDITGTDILNMLVEEGILTEAAAEKLIDKVRQRNQRAEQAISQQPVAPTGEAQRVPYVPNYVKEQIKNDVATEVRGQVLEDVIQHAKTERWGIPNAQPSWTDKVSFSGDGRLRYQWDRMDKGNEGQQIVDVNAANSAGGTLGGGRDLFYQVAEDNHRLRGRFRVMMKAKPTQGVELGLRLVTGNEGNPVSSNQTLGNYGEKWDVNFDLAYLKYTNLTDSFNLQGGRIKNPFLHTDLVWDDDLTFEGVASTWYMMRDDDMDDDFRQWDPFITIGAFPIQEINVSSLPIDTISAPNDKWLYAAQLGTHYDWWDQSRFSIGLSYYYYENITGTRNVVGDDLQDSTASPFYQFGNWTYDIDPSASSNLYALASEYELANLTLKYDYAGLAPHHIVVSGDVVRNLAFDADDIAARSLLTPDQVPDRDFGYQLGVMVGWPNLDLRGNWRMSVMYRRLEGDAVLDAFADSDFLLGGTNARGYVLRADYALMDNVYTSLRWISADEIDADIRDNIEIDHLFLDIGAEF